MVKHRSKSSTRKLTPWQMHVKNFRKAHPEIPYNKIFKEAAKSYHNKKEEPLKFNKTKKRKHKKN